MAEIRLGFFLSRYRVIVLSQWVHYNKTWPLNRHKLECLVSSGFSLLESWLPRNTFHVFTRPGE